MFKRVKFAYDALPPILKAERTAKVDSARELVFNNGSSLRVGTSMRGTTLQYLHISEFGKICAKFPDKATEILTGSLNTIAPGQYVFIESTAEGREGHFFNICKQAQANEELGKELTKLDFQFHFFPWWKEPSYRMGAPVILQQSSLDYFLSLRGRGIELDAEQKYWYCARAATQGDNMLREYPSTPEEAWESAIDGSYYSKQVSIARVEKRIGYVPYDRTIPVHTAWDLGYNDATAIWFVQFIGQEIHLIEYMEGSGESLAYWLGIIKSKPYVYGTHLAPHDIMAHEFTTGITRQAAAYKLGFQLIPVPKIEIITGIDLARDMFNRCWFNEAKCAKGINALENYKKEWNERTASWASKPLHNWASHCADSFRTLACGLDIVGKTIHNPLDPNFGRRLGQKNLADDQMPRHTVVNYGQYRFR